MMVMDAQLPISAGASLQCLAHKPAGLFQQCRGLFFRQTCQLHDDGQLGIAAGWPGQCSRLLPLK